MRDGSFDEFVNALARIERNLPTEAARWLDACGMMFLDEIQREIIRSRTVDTRRLLTSFSKGSSDNLWVISEGGLTLEVGTNVEYAKYANDGHFTTKSGVASRWVPGIWVGDRFEYQPGASTGMLLRHKWVDGSQYFDTAFSIFSRMFERAINNRFESYMARQLGSY